VNGGYCCPGSEIRCLREFASLNATGARRRDQASQETGRDRDGTSVPAGRHLPRPVHVVKNMVMIQVNVFEMKAKLSEYLDRVARGERIIVCRHNKPVAELRPIEAVRTEPRPIGPLPGRPSFEVPASFFEPLSDDELELWEGGTSTDHLAAGSVARARRSRTRVAEDTTPYDATRPKRSRRRS
jgi:prevent-host-death family protein